MSEGELVIVALAGPALEAPVAAPFAVRRVVAAQSFGSPQEIASAADLEHAHVLWLPPWAQLTPSIVASVAAWLGSPEPPEPGAGLRRVAYASLRLRCGTTSLAVGPRHLVLSSPGTVDLVGDTPCARPMTRGADLTEPWEAWLPDDLNAHLEAVNMQTSTAARLRHAAGQPPTWRSLTLVPLERLVRGLASVCGSRREALPRVVVEAYREVLVAAKLWELAHGPAVA